MRKRLLVWLCLPLSSLFLGSMSGANVPTTQPNTQPVAQQTGTVYSVEAYYPLWSLVRLESMRKDIVYPFSRRRGDFAGRNLRGVNAAGLDLTGFNFRYADLRGADFSNSILASVNFENADLSEALFTSAEDHGVFFNNLTKLPFSRETALRRGWIEIKK